MAQKFSDFLFYMIQDTSIRLLYLLWHLLKENNLRTEITETTEEPRESWENGIGVWWDYTWSFLFILIFQCHEPLFHLLIMLIWVVLWYLSSKLLWLLDAHRWIGIWAIVWKMVKIGAKGNERKHFRQKE